MNRKQKIIVSITGIFLVLMILVGLTYAYFLTKITGNTNEKSISVTTANLAIVYEDNSAEILGKDLILEPNSEKEIGTKTFTVTNKGNAKTSYVVVIDETKITNATDGTTTTFESNDFRYTLTCTEGCNGVETQSVFPINGGVLVGNSIDVGKVQTYELKLWYIDTGIDQTNDMNKRLEARVNITDITQMKNPYSSNKNSLAYNIIENAKNKTNGTELVSSPKTTPIEMTSLLKYYKDKIEESSSESTITLTTAYQAYYWTYGAGYTIDENTGKFTLTDVSTCKYNDNECNKTLNGKYLVSTTATRNAASTNIKKTTTNLSNIYKVTDSPESSTSSIQMKIKSISSIAYSTEKELSIEPDDYGTSYYYRGGVEDNYVNFAGICWRIVRIEGDGSTKLILEDSNHECNNASFTGNWTFYGDVKVKYDYDSNTGGLSVMLQSYSNSTLTTYISNKYENKTISDYLKNDDWCYDDSISVIDGFGYDSNGNKVTEKDKATNVWFTNEYYGTYTRINTNKKPSLVCTGSKLNQYNDNTNMYVGTLTADEIAFAGAQYSLSSCSKNYTYYLTNKYTKENELSWWSISPSHLYANDSHAYYLRSDNCLSENYTSSLFYTRPSITLLSTVQISSGNGTISNPYEIS